VVKPGMMEMEIETEMEIEMEIERLFLIALMGACMCTKWG